MTVTEKVVLNKKLKTDFPHVNGSNDDSGGRRKLICRLRIVPKNQSVITGTGDLLQDNMDSCSISDYGTQKLSSNMASVSLRKRKPGMGNKNHLSVETLEDHREPVPNKFETVTSATGFKMLDNQNIKGPSILDANKTKQCAGILRKLMLHKHGWVFNQPVDPVKLNIPDYFCIIQNSMDLGTIKKKLESKKYMKATQFANDVRLTFANAMRYNPPGNDVHIMAKILNDIFSKSWKVLEAKWNEDHTMQDKSGRKTCSLRYVIPQSGTSPDSHCKQLLVSADCGHKRDATGRSAEMHLRKDAERPCSLDRGQASPGASCIVVSNTNRGSGDEDAGPEGNFGDENPQPSPSTSHAMSNLGIVEPLAGEHGSPSKALRAAILKRRFADTILKAQQKKLNHGEKEDPEQIKREKERMERMRQMERIKTEAEMKAAEEAIRRTKEAELKFQREKEREAARLALQQMEKTVNIDENYELLRDLQSFGYVEPIDRMSGETGLNLVEEYLSPGSLGNPLERLGLFMKDEYFDQDDDAAIVSAAVAHADMEDEDVCVGCGRRGALVVQ